MVKSKKTTAKTGPAKPKRTPNNLQIGRPQGWPSAGGLDRSAIDWAKLLMDPCGAPLVPPCYSTGAGSAMIFRSESDYIGGNSATETGTVQCFVPGLNGVMFSTTAVVTDTTAILLTLQSSGAPSGSWLDNNAGSVRCVAARTEISFPGSELNRAGVVSLGLMDAGAFVTNLGAGEGGGGLTTTVAQVRRMCQHVERTPGNMCAVNWAPGTNDGDPDSTLLDGTRAAKLQGRNCLVMTASGLPAATGMRVRHVAVYEVTLNPGSIGVVNSVDPPPSRNTTGQILKAMYDKKPGWIIEAGPDNGSNMRYSLNKRAPTF